MRWLRSLFYRLTSRFRRRSRLVDDGYDDHRPSRRTPIQILQAIVLFPIRLLFLPFKALGIFHDTGIELEEYHKTASLKKRLARGGKWLLWLPFRLLYAPIKFLNTLRTAERKEMMFILPALLMIAFFGFVFVQVFARSNVIENRYKKGAQDAMADADFQLAKTYFQRIIASQELTPPQTFQWAMILTQTGEPERAENLFKRLAPDDELGYGPAHRLMAISLAKQLGRSTDPQKLRTLRWHLQNSRDLSPETQQAWASYYLAVEQFDNAIKALDKAAEINPSYYQKIATIYKSQGRSSESRIALGKAETAYRKMLKKDDLDHRVRVALANVNARLGNYAEAERLLKQGLRIQPDAFIRRAMSNFFVTRHDLAKKENADAATQISFLVDAINFDPNYGPVYSRMMAMFFSGEKTPEESTKVRETLLEIVTGDNPTPLAHFALSNILWQKGKKEQAQFHLEQAYKMNKSIVVVLNNLAWMLAHTEDPNLERARELAEAAVKQKPGDPRFRDTLGTIYIKQERFSDAVSELQLALSSRTDKKTIHQKLAVAYQGLGMNDLSKIHAEKGKKE